MNSKRHYHRKLVRDNIPAIIAANGDRFKTARLSKKQFENELKKKLIEESREVAKASKDTIGDELADVLEVIKSLAQHYKIPFQHITKTQLRKRKKRGGFAKRLFLTWSTGKRG